MKDLTNELGSENVSKDKSIDREDDNSDDESLDSEGIDEMLNELQDRIGIVIEKKDDLDENEEEKDITMITDGAFNQPNPQQQNENVQSKQKQKKNNQQKKKDWKVSDIDLPVPILALANSNDSIFTISNYINAYSNRPYAFDYASGTKYYREESNFDAIDAVTSLAQKSELEMEIMASCNSVARV